MTMIMRNKNITKIIAGVLIFAQILWALPFFVDAQLVGCGVTPVTGCYTYSPGESPATVVTNGAAAGTATVAFAAYQAALTAVQGAETANNVSSNATSVTSASYLAMLTTILLPAYQTFLTTARAQLAIINNIPPSSIYINTLKQQYTSQMNSAINTYAARAKATQTLIATGPLTVAFATYQAALASVQGTETKSMLRNWDLAPVRC